MTKTSKIKLGFLAVVLAVPVLPQQIVLAGEEQRAPPQARTAGTLGPQVMRAISSIQELMQPEDEEDEPDLAAAKLELDELYDRRWERMNDFEKQTVLNFYTNYWLTLENYPEAINTFKQLLEIEALREDTRLRTLKSLGQLTAAEEIWQDSILYYELWREASLVEDDIVYRGLSYAHYQADEFDQALPYWIDYMEFQRANGVPLGRDDYAYLNGLYFTLEDFPNALELTKTMIALFDNPTDRRNLNSILSVIEDSESNSLSVQQVEPDNYADCVVQGVSSDVAARAIIESCRNQFPTEPEEVVDVPAPAVADASHDQDAETLNYPGGDVYVGELRDNKRNGQGTYTFASGEVAEGEWRDDELNGQGTYTFTNGNVYVGEFRDNKRNGQGTYTFANGAVYVGEFRDAKYHGQGTLTSADGDGYVGEFKDNVPNGQGTFTLGSGDILEGEFRDGKLNGQGTHTFPNGNVYVGEFKDGLRHGQGTHTFASGGRIRRGLWENGEFRVAN